MSKIVAYLAAVKHLSKGCWIAPPRWLNNISLVLFILFMATLPARSMDASEGSFIWNEANALMGSATAVEDYWRAAQTYQKLVDAGIHNGPLFYNLGTALLKAERYAEALDALARAERYLGYQADIAHNMKIALGGKQKTLGVEWPWYRTLLFWHFTLSSSMRLAIATMCFTLFWLALALRRLGLERGINTVIILALLACFAFGSSAATTWYQENTARRYILGIPALPLPNNPWPPPAASAS